MWLRRRSTERGANRAVVTTTPIVAASVVTDVDSGRRCRLHPTRAAHRARRSSRASDGTTAIAAPYPEPTWYCARADGTRHGAFITLFPDRDDRDRRQLQGRQARRRVEAPLSRRRGRRDRARTPRGCATARGGSSAPTGTVLGEYTLKARHRHAEALARRWSAVQRDARSRRACRTARRRSSIATARSSIDGEATARQARRRARRRRQEHAADRGDVRARRARAGRARSGSSGLLVDENYDDKGKLDGAFTIWRDKKVPRVQGTYEHGKRIGTWVWTDKNNKKEREGDYLDGKKRGPWTECDRRQADVPGHVHRRQARRRLRLLRQDGQRARPVHDQRRHRHDADVPSEQEDRDEDAAWSRAAWRASTRSSRCAASSSSKVATSRDKKHGLWREQTELGVPTLEQHWKRGKLDGAWKKYVDGKVAVDGDVQGRQGRRAVHRVPRWQARADGQFAADQRTGTWTTYDADGAVTLIATYKDGVLDGPWRQLVAGVVLEGTMSGGRRSRHVDPDRSGRSEDVCDVPDAVTSNRQPPVTVLAGAIPRRGHGVHSRNVALVTSSATPADSRVHSV